MDEKKIAFIIHRTNDAACMETINSLTELEIPEDFEIELLPLAGAEKFSVYNAAMTQTDAKYKIYLDEKVSVVNKNILPELVELFRSDETIGIIGTSGAIELSTHGISLNSAKRCGKIFMDAEKYLTDWGGGKNFLEADAADGWFFATQHDFAWREDLFRDNYFGDAAQCAEFRRRGYKTFLKVEDAPQIWVRIPELTINDQARRNFLEEYSAEIFPLVTVVIPTFNRPKYFQEALISVLTQTYRNFEIFVSDNSTNDETEILIQKYLEKFPCIKYFHHKDFDVNDNWSFARQYDNPKTVYLNWLMDDDLLYPRKFEFMVEIFRNNPEVSLVTSVRNIIDAEGKVTGQMIYPAEVPRKNAQLDGRDAINLIFKFMDNFIGEPTTVLMKKSCLRENDLCWSSDENGFFSMNDVSTWCQLLSKGDLFYFADQPLSAFRDHKGQITNWDITPTISMIIWAKLFTKAWDEKIFIETEDDLHEILLLWIAIAAMTLQEAHRENFHGKEIGKLEEILVAMTQALTNGFKINLPPLEMPNWEKKKIFGA